MSSLQLDRLTTALAGRYSIVREIGRGGMATVYLVDDLKHRRQVALKVLHPELGQILGADRFAREIQMAAALNHPHILPLYDSGSHGGKAGKRGSGNEALLWFSMPYVRGESLRQKLNRERQLSVDEAVRIVRQIASALDFAHAHGLIHRDVKPENILIHEGEAMVTDFGIALDSGTAGKRESGKAERLTELGVAMGTAEYMSPEQISGERSLDGRSDVYSLGCVLYELLAGEPPYTGITSQAVMIKRFVDPVPRIRRLRPSVPASVEQAIMKALTVAPADRFATAAEFAEALTRPLEKAERASIAVLPFLNLSADAENEFFADGITEDVIAQLSKIRALKVLSRASVTPYKRRQQSPREIGAALDVATVLDGSVRRAGNRVRIAAQLVDTETERQLWSETYDRELTDIFAIQTDVALHIAAALKAELSPEEQRRIQKEPTQDVQAYQLFLLGKHCISRWTKEGIDQGLDYFQQAVERDPGYAMAYAAIAHAYLELGIGVAGDMPPEKAFPQAKDAIAKAIRADPGLAEAHAMLGFARFVCDHDWAGADREFKLALELNPNSGSTYDAYGLMLSALQRYDEALVVQQRAHELDPLSHRLDRATTMLRAGRHQEGLEIAIGVNQLDPHFAMGRATLGWSYIYTGEPERGIAELERAVSLSPDSTMFLAQLGEAYARVGKSDQAREVLQRLQQLSTERYVSPYHFGYVYTGLGELDRAMDWLERAYAEGAGGIWGIKGSFLFAPLREHPRFRALLKKINLE